MKKSLKNQLQQPKIPDPPLPTDPITRTIFTCHWDILYGKLQAKNPGQQNMACDQKLHMSGEEVALSIWVFNSGLFLAAAWVSEQTMSMALFCLVLLMS